MTIVITDPCYLESRPPLKRRDTIYGDWSCMVYKGDRKENTLPEEWDEKYFAFFSSYNSGLTEKEKEKKYKEFMAFKDKWLEDNCLGEFCADGGEVAVFDWDSLSQTDKDWCKSHPWCAAIIKDFTGHVDFEVEDDCVFVVGKGNFNFFSIQSGL
jgi:hypothetical protein